MCKDCVISHISGILEDIRGQVENPSCDQLQLFIHPVKMCNMAPMKSSFVSLSSRKISFPGTSVVIATAFVRMVRILDMILTNLTSDKIVTSRNIYYQDVALFKDQRNVVRCIDRLIRLFRIPRSELNVMPSPNGLLSGNLTIALSSGGIFESKRTNGTTLIPVQDIMYVSAHEVPKFILIVEKEAVFSFLQSELNEAIVITGRGFPDHATRNLVKALHTTYPEVPVYGLVDSDPHGILICRNYEYGSALTAEDDTRIAIKYLGVSLLEYDCDLVPSTINDLKLSVSTLKKPWIHQPEYHAHKVELQRGLFMSVKGEIDQLDRDQSQRLSRYVRNKVNAVQDGGDEVFFLPEPRLVCHGNAKYQEEIKTGAQHSSAKRPGAFPFDDLEVQELSGPTKGCKPLPKWHSKASKHRRKMRMVENEHGV